MTSRKGAQSPCRPSNINLQGVMFAKEVYVGRCKVHLVAIQKNIETSQQAKKRNHL
jgi:hypothetical protein